MPGWTTSLPQHRCYFKKAAGDLALAISTSDKQVVVKMVKLKVKWREVVGANQEKKAAGELQSGKVITSF